MLVVKVRLSLAMKVAHVVNEVDFGYIGRGNGGKGGGGSKHRGEVVMAVSVTHCPTHDGDNGSCSGMRSRPRKNQVVKSKKSPQVCTVKAQWPRLCTCLFTSSKFSHRANTLPSHEACLEPTNHGRTKSTPT